MKHTKFSKLYTLLFVVLLALSTAVMLSACGDATEPPTTQSTKVEVTTAPFVANEGDELVVAHITDTHYFPENLCYNGADLATTDYYTDLITNSKMLVESSLFNVQALKEIAAKPLAELPDVLVVSGDISKDGELQSHVEMANLLRGLQNAVRAKGKTNFQVLVSLGNHDMYNGSSAHFRNGGVQTLTSVTTRTDAVKIYCGLGFPDLTAAEYNAFYDTLQARSAVFENDLPYTPDEGCENFVRSTNSAAFAFTYQYVENGHLIDLESSTISDYDNGDLTYVAKSAANKYVFLSVDEEVSNEETGHYVGGQLYASTKGFVTTLQTAEYFDGFTLIGIMHHNAVPHFDLEDSLLKDFTIYNWKYTSDYFADLGVEYFFTGHMHSNDIATTTSFNNNVLTDIETSSVTGYMGGTRYCKIVRGKSGTAYATTFSSYFDLLDKFDITSAFSNNYLTADYVSFSKVTDFVSLENGTYYCTNPSDYAKNKLFVNIVNNYMSIYITPDFISNVGSLVLSILPDMLKSFAGIDKLVNNIIVHVEDVVLANYTYTGTNETYKGNARGQKLCGYIDDLLNSVLNMPVSDYGDTLFSFGMGCYFKHVSGLDMPYEDLTAGEKQALAGLKDGTLIKKLLDTLLDEQTGLLRIVYGLFEPMNLSYGITDDTTLQGIAGVIGLVIPSVAEATNSDSPDYSVLAAVDLDDALPKIGEYLAMFGFDIGIDFDTDNSSGVQIIKDLLDGYVTDSLYSSLGEIAGGILESFSVDETAYSELSTTKFVQYSYNATLSATQIEGAGLDAPSAENGKLPSMLTVTFGSDVSSTKNFTWFTDKRVLGSDIQYVAGTTFDVTKATTASGVYKHVATTTASIDLGVFATLMHLDLVQHTVDLTGLSASTTYSYRVGSVSDNFWSEVYTFTTGPSDNEAFEMLLISDIQGSALSVYEQTATIMTAIEKEFGSFDTVVNCGDLIDNSRNLVQWKYMLDSSSIWSNVTQIVTAGNHDKYTYESFDLTDPDDAAEYEWFDLTADRSAYSYLLLHYNISYPEQNDLTGAYYSFDYSGVHFSVLNTNDVTENGISEAQLNWLKTDLDSTDKIKVVIMHKGLYSSGSHSEDADVIAMRAQLTPVFAEKGVCVALSGHDHTYSETYYLDKNGKSVGSLASNGKLGKDGAVLYITLGTLGDKLYNYVANDEVPVDFGADLHNPTLENPTFAVLKYDGKDLYYVAYEYDLETGKISKLHGMAWWEILLIAVGAAAVAAGITAAVVVVLKNKKQKAALVGTDTADGNPEAASVENDDTAGNNN